MDFSGKIVLSFIEEDNVQRAYFRIRPLLMSNAAVTAEDISALPDDGYLRVVPDKNEQHTFKERMRDLGKLCVLNLKDVPPEITKIRNNKNYAPARGETNQYIVYSDAVQSLPQCLVFEVITAEQGDKDKIVKSLTPLCYLRNGGNIYGPVSRATALAQDDACQLQPDSEGIFSISMPDDTEHLFYWPRSEEITPRRAEAVKEAPKDENETEEAPSADTPSKPLNGVPLYQTMARRPLPPQRAHNPLMETVDQQMRASRMEAPGAVLQTGTSTHQVETPMESYKRSLNVLWSSPEMQRQAVSHLLSMTGIQNVLNQQLAGKGTDAVSSAMNSQIQDLEAERLALIMQVENAEKNLSAIRKGAIEQATREETETLKRLQKENQDARTDLDKMNISRAELIQKRDEVLSQMKKAGVPVLASEIGGHTDLKTLTERVQSALTAQGIACSKDEAIHLLTVFCVCEGQMEIKAMAVADAFAAAKAFADAIGASYASYKDNMVMAEGGDNAKIVLASCPDEPDTRYTRVVVNSQADEGAFSRGAGALNPFPTVCVHEAENWKPGKVPSFAPINQKAVYDCVTADAGEIPQSIEKLVMDMDGALRKSGAALPRALLRMMYAYLAPACIHMDGGAAKALDLAVCTFIVPCLKNLKADMSVLKPYVSALPKAAAEIGGKA